MKYIARYILAQILACALAIAPIHAFAQQSNPGFTYGQVPTAAQWNSYFSAKLDYNANGLAILLGGTGATDGAAALTNMAGAATSGQYLRGNGTRIVLGAIQAGDVPGLAGGAVGSIPYQSAANTTAYLAGNTTTATFVLTSIGTGAVATTPTYSLTTGTGAIFVVQSNPTINTPTMTGGSWTGATGVATTTLSASSTVSGTGFSTYLASPPAIGTTTPAAVKSTTLQATSTFSMTNLVASAAAPTVSGASCGNTSSVSANNGTISFRLSIGNSTNTCAITLPTATNGWNCFGQNMTALGSTNTVRLAASSTTSATLNNYNNAGTLTNYGSGDVVAVICAAY